MNKFEIGAETEKISYNRSIHIRQHERNNLFNEYLFKLVELFGDYIGTMADLIEVNRMSPMRMYALCLSASNEHPVFVVTFHSTALQLNF